MEELGKILPRALKNHVRGERAPVLAVLAGVWPRVAGKAMAEQARPLAFSSGTLTLAVHCPTWAAQLQGLRQEICGAINRALGGTVVRHLRVKLVARDEAGAQAAVELPRAPALAIGPGRPDMAALETLGPELRAVVSRSFAKYFARPAGKVH
ncbi:MAG TPA: DUF721 domain-containing protein [Terriglobia bacterium]|jgi:hypothetical protein|nr:DUF721 domain-containing protein [Terriglobia bacterium]